MTKLARVIWAALATEAAIAVVSVPFFFISSGTPHLLGQIVLLVYEVVAVVCPLLGFSMLFLFWLRADNLPAYRREGFSSAVTAIVSLAAWLLMYPFVFIATGHSR